MNNIFKAAATGDIEYIKNALILIVTVNQAGHCSCTL